MAVGEGRRDLRRHAATSGTDAERSGATDETLANLKLSGLDRRGEPNREITNTRGYRGGHRAGRHRDRG